MLSKKCWSKKLELRVFKFGRLWYYELHLITLQIQISIAVI